MVGCGAVSSLFFNGLGIGALAFLWKVLGGA
jgi:hypothetical protein